MAIEDIFARVRERKGLVQDVSGLQQFLLQQQQSQGAAQQLAAALSVPPDQRQGLPGINFPAAPQFPQAQSTQGAQLFGNILLQQQQQQGALGLQAARPRTPSQIQAAEITRIQNKPVSQRTAEEKDILRVSQGLPTTPQEQFTISQIGKNRAEAEKQLRAGRGILTPEQKISQTNVFRKEFDALSKDFRIIRDSFGRLKAAALDPSGAGDIALIFNFMKILDPSSVVRESEFATAENAASVPIAIRNMWNKALTGERIKFNRADFIKTAENIIGAQEKQQKTLIERYAKLSNRFGLNPEDVITETNIDTGSNLPSAEQSELDALIKERDAVPNQQLGPTRQQQPQIPQPNPFLQLGTGGLRF